MIDKEISHRKKEKNPEWIIDNIAEASRNARAIYLLFIGFLAYCAITVINTKDMQLILNETAHLPIINLDVPLNGFFLLSPVLAIIVFIYLQLYIHRLKGLINDLRTNYPSVEKRRLYPWMLNIAEDPEPGIIGRLQKIMFNFSLWWLLPIVLIFFPLGFLRKHDPFWSNIVGLIPVFGTAVVIWFWCQYERVKLKRFLHGNPGKISLSIMVLLFGIYYIFFLIPWSFDGDKSGLLRHLLYVDLSYQKLVNEQEIEYETLYWVDLAGANLEGANFTESILKRANLRNSKLINANFYNANLEGARLEDAKLQCANLRKAKLDSADLSGAHLQGAHLDSAQLQGAKLMGAQLQGTHLDSAQLQGAKFRGAQLQGAFLRKAQLQSAELREAQLQGAILTSAELQGAILWMAELDSADLSNAQLQGAFLRFAKLDNADLRNAKLQDADLKGAELRYAQLDNTNLMDAILNDADFSHAQLKGADLSYAQLKGARNLTIEQLSKVKTLYKAELDSILMKGIKTDYPHLLLSPKYKILPKPKRP